MGRSLIGPPSAFTALSLSRHDSAAADNRVSRYGALQENSCTDSRNPLKFRGTVNGEQQKRSVGNPVEHEFDCEDCDRSVVVFGRATMPVPALCLTCEWIRLYVPAEHVTAMRERLGVPLVSRAD